jgi:hypothetical protein
MVIESPKGIIFTGPLAAARAEKQPNSATLIATSLNACFRFKSFMASFLLKISSIF